MSTCTYGDPTCPCQDGDLCHYVPSPDMDACRPHVAERLAAL